ncbi:glycoside hydrolase family 36 protein [Hypoxylon sp. FL1284]|nr:glycoside hydrolase family 36 protein [Hypoxylon sp. FL1284]
MSQDEHGIDSEFHAVCVPSPSTPAPMMHTKISSYPPLGQVTQLGEDSTSFRFLALLEVGSEHAKDPWEVAVWHSSATGDWVETLLSPISGTDSPFSLQSISPSRTFLYFCGPDIHSSLQFTLKFRNSRNQPWRWSREVSGIADGVVLITPPTPSNDAQTSLSDVIHGLNPDLKVEGAASQTPRTQLWTINADVGPSQDDCSAYTDIELGTPWGGSLRYFALVRHGSPWLGPRHGSTPFSLDKDAVMCSFLGSQGKHLVLLGVSGVANVMTLLRSSDSGSVKLHIRNDAEDESSGLVLAAVGDNFESAIAAVMYHARAVVFATRDRETAFSRELRSLSDDVKPEWYENWYDGLGYCTWNALGQRLTDEKIINAVEALAKDHINISTLIIDDNWQDIDYNGDDQYQRGWKGFEAEPNAFPRGLKDTVARIRSKHSSIQSVVVWHALLGYWGGLSGGGELAKIYKTVQVNRDDSNLKEPMIVIAEEDVDRFYNDFYKFLSDCGVDGVKTDVQYMIDTWVSAKHRRELSEKYLDTWIIAALRHFSIRAISCMSQAPQLLFHQQLPRNRPLMLTRNSDDFYPDIPDSHPWHIFCNAYNSLLTQHLNILPDWDMFQTDHEVAGFHAAARCLSGGPIYITDVPGKHNVDLINQMTGPTPRGQTVIFRPSVVGKSINAYISIDDPVILKIGSYHGRAVIGTPMLGVFNTSRQSLSEAFPISLFPGVLPLTKYVVRSHRSGLVTPVTFPTTTVAVSLDVRDYDIFTAFPVTQFQSETNGRLYIANLGLIGKMTGAAAILTYQSELLHTGRVFFDTRLKALGVLGRLPPLRLLT